MAPYPLNSEGFGDAWFLLCLTQIPGLPNLLALLGISAARGLKNDLRNTGHYGQQPGGCCVLAGQDFEVRLNPQVADIPGRVPLIKMNPRNPGLLILGLPGSS